MNDMNTLDITPTPRILRTLGEIPFQTWQCVAELIDNSIDAFLSDKTAVSEEVEREIAVTWASDSVSANDRTIEVTDNACGMSIEQLQNAVRAGYSSNDPIGNLGLFGMGFNISTARLGEVTTIMSTRSGDLDWVGVTIDFQKLIATKRFDAPIVHMHKANQEEQGTKITISRLRHGILTELPNKAIESRLEQLSKTGKHNRSNTTVYVLTNFNTDFDFDLYRVEKLKSLNIQPYVMIYKRDTAKKPLRHLQRYANNPYICWTVKNFNEYIQ